MNSIVYVALWDVFRPYDYAYVFNYGAVFLQVLGLAFIGIIMTRIFNSSNQKKALIVCVLVFGILLYTGYQRIHYKSHQWGRKQAMESDSALLRKGMENYISDDDMQFLILGSLSNPHRGNFRVNTGYVRYLLKRNDVYALIGPEMFPNDIFEDEKDWFHRMSGFDSNKPVAAFRVQEEQLEPVRYILQLSSTGRIELPRLQWNLFDVSNYSAPPVSMKRGAGIRSYLNYIADEGQSEDIAFAPPDQTDEFIHSKHADVLSECNGLLGNEVGIDDNFTLRNILISDKSEAIEIALLLRVDSMPNTRRYRLGYEIPELRIKSQLTLWDYLMSGDHLLIRVPSVNEEQLIKGFNISFLNMGTWPHKYLTVSNGFSDEETSIPINGMVSDDLAVCEEIEAYSELYECSNISLIDESDNDVFILADSSFSVWGFDSFYFVGDNANSSVMVNKNEERVKLLVDAPLNDCSRIQTHYSDSELLKYSGKAVKLYVEVDVNGLEKGSFYVAIYDKINVNGDLDYKDSISRINSNGSHRIELKHDVRDAELQSLGFFPGSFTVDANAGSQAIIREVILTTE